MNAPPHDHDAALARLLSDEGGEYTALYRRLARAQPPRRLDRAVLGEAARAVRGQEPRGQRWWTWLGSAAGLVLAAGIAWRVGHEPLPPPGPTGIHRQTIPVEAITAPRGRHQPAATQAPPASADLGQARAPLSAPAAPMPVLRSQKMASAPPAAAISRAGESRPGTQADTARPRQAPPVAPKGDHAQGIQSSADTTPTADFTKSMADIRRLLRDGQRAQAIMQLRNLHAAHPEAALPADLAALLEPATSGSGKR